ncbi:MAG TPA: ribbon-helix-helix protein, CopG family [Spirochaetales bacterium]|nr:ribbon-helix-helix protein, CopG family [Spirochaetales bacterium]
MKRTQIYIDENMYKLLEVESKIEKKTISEIIRETIESRLQANVEKLIVKAERIRGLRKDKTNNVDGYIKTLRRDRAVWS